MKLENKEQMEYALSILREEGEVSVLQITGTKKGNLVGYFDDLDKLMYITDDYNGTSNMFVSLNPVTPDLLARAKNRTLPRVKQPIIETDILKRSWLPININPVRLDGISATEEEHNHAINIARKIVKEMKEEGWPDAVIADSGNGAHILYYLDLLNDEESKKLIKDVLKVFSLNYSDDIIKVDTETFKAEIMWRFYGTVTIKGDETNDRIHRRSKVLYFPDEGIEDVSIDKLKQFASQAENSEKEKSSSDKENSETQADILIRH